MIYFPLAHDEDLAIDPQVTEEEPPHDEDVNMDLPVTEEEQPPRDEDLRMDQPSQDHWTLGDQSGMGGPTRQYDIGQGSDAGEVSNDHGSNQETYGYSPDQFQDYRIRENRPQVENSMPFEC